MLELNEVELTEEQLEAVTGGFDPNYRYDHEYGDRDDRDDHHRRHWHPGHYEWQHRHRSWVPGEWW